MFGTAAGVACDELNESAREDLGGGVISILARFEDFVFVEDARRAVHGLFGTVIPAHVYPMISSVQIRLVRSRLRRERGVPYGLPSFENLCDDGFFCVVGVGEGYPVT